MDAFIQENIEVAEEWRSRVVVCRDWEVCDNQAGATPGDDVVTGEAGGFFVDVKELDRRAYLKPAKSRGSQSGLENAKERARAAREKIAADLAYELDLPVPPAVLEERDNAPEFCERAVVLTLVMYPRQMSWSQVRGYNPGSDSDPVAKALREGLQQSGPMWVFDTWIKQTDHADHAHNIVWGYDPESYDRSGFVFLDFANSLGHQGSWENGGWGNISKAGFPKLMKQEAQKDEIDRTVEKIEALPESRINEIVQRIPESHIDTEQRDLIAEALVGRRELLSGVF